MAQLGLGSKMGTVASPEWYQQGSWISELAAQAPKASPPSTTSAQAADIWIKKPSWKRPLQCQLLQLQPFQAQMLRPPAISTEAPDMAEQRRAIFTAPLLVSRPTESANIKSDWDFVLLRFGWGGCYKTTPSAIPIPGHRAQVVYHQAQTANKNKYNKIKTQKTIL